MGVKKVNVDFNLGAVLGRGGTSVRIQGAEYFYDDPDIRKNIGADETDENDFVRYVVDEKAQWSKWLIPLVAVMRSDTLLNDTGQGKIRYFNFYCAPDKVDEAFEDLPGKAVDANLLPGDWEIEKVVRKRDISYS